MEGIRRKSTSIGQLDLLITFMEAHTNFAAGKYRSKEGRALATRMWEQCADIVNSEGVTRTPKNWSKFWNDYKFRVRAKLAELNRGSSGTGGGPSKAPQLSPLEKRVVALLGRDVGPLTGVHQDPSIEIQYVNAEEMGKDLNETPAAANSSILKSIIHESSAASGNSSPVSQDLSRTLSIESEQRDSVLSPHVEECNRIADRGTTASQTDRPRRRQLRLTRRRAGGRLRLVHQINTAALDESRATIARIEEIRARTAETVATAALNMSNAMNNISNSTTSISNAMACMAESLRIYLGSSHTEQSLYQDGEMLQSTAGLDPKPSEVPNPRQAKSPTTDRTDASVSGPKPRAPRRVVRPLPVEDITIIQVDEYRFIAEDGDSLTYYCSEKARCRCKATLCLNELNYVESIDLTHNHPPPSPLPRFPDVSKEMLKTNSVALLACTLSNPNNVMQ